MTWSYSTALTSEKDQVRFTIGDTDTTAQLLQDEEITWSIGQETSMWGTAARCCESISRNFLRKADVRVGRGGTQLVYSKVADSYAAMALAFRNRANALHAPWAGGVNITDKQTLAGDASKVQPIFAKHEFENPWVGGQDLSVVADQDG